MLPTQEIPMGIGIHTLYYNNGNMKSSFEYVLDIKTMTLQIKDGTYKTCYEDGTLKTLTTFKKNKLHGKCTYYNSKGVPEEVILYENGEITSIYRRSSKDPNNLLLLPMTN